MILFRELFKILLFLLIVISSVIVGGAIVRNIHHPALELIRDPVIYAADLPRDFYREFFQGAETDTPYIPPSVRGKNFHPELVGADVTYEIDGKLYRNGTSIDTLGENSATSIQFFDLSGRFYVGRDNGGIFRVDLFGPQKGQRLNYQLKRAHHEYHIDEDGYLYTPIYFSIKDPEFSRSKTATLLANVLAKDNAPPYGLTSDVFRDDGVQIISPEGRLVHQVSLTELFQKNNMMHYVYSTGLEVDPFHLNSVYPAKRDFGKVKKGDLLLSLRHRSMILIYRPSNMEVIWYKIGPWLNQHSAKFDHDGNIYLFNNNLIESVYRRRRESGLIEKSNNILRYRFDTGTVEEVRGCEIPNDVKTTTGGRVNIIGDLIHIDFSNSMTSVICNTKTGNLSYLVPRYDTDGRVLKGSSARIIEVRDLK